MNVHDVKEIWKPIKGYEGCYEVSNLGNVKSIDRWVIYKNGIKHYHKGKMLKPTTSHSGYLKVILYKNRKPKNRKVHRLVVEAFIPNSNNLPEVNHKDENKLNNKIDNLERCTREYNNNYGTRNMRVAISQSKQVYQYDLKGNLIKIWNSIMEIERNLNYNNSNISACCLKKIKTAYNYVWSYKPIHNFIAEDYKTKVRGNAILQLDKNGNLIKEWSNMYTAGQNGFSIPHISQCCKGKRKTHKGCIWKLKEESTNE